MEIPPYSFLQIAREHTAEESYKEAFKYYLKAIETYPRMRRIVEFEFRIVLVKCNEHLTLIDNHKPPILTNFQAAMKAFPGSVNLLSDIGKYLYQHSHICEALVHFERALQIDSSLVNIEKNLDSAKKIIFPRTHYRLLNDVKRNTAYMDALRAIVMPNAECVLDLDTGTGLSALYADACDAVSTAACDRSQTMANLAGRVMNDNNIQKVLVINKPPNKLGLNDVYGERTMLITNRFDPGLLGDQLLQTLKHAWQNLLTEFGRVLPGRAEYYVMGAKCDRAMLKYQLGSEPKKLLGVSDLNVNTEIAADETYYGEDIHLYDDIEYVTNAKMVFSINFNDYNDITRKLKVSKPHKVFLKAKKDTEVNILVGWFVLYVHEGITLTTDPRSADRTSAWQQAVFFDFIPRSIKHNQTMCVKFKTYGGKLKFIRDDKKEIIRLSPSAIAFLNDVEYMDAIADCVKAATVYLGQINDVSEFVIADFSPFPLFGMMMMMRGARSLLAFARHACDKVFIEKVFTQNNVSLTNVTILVADYWNHTFFKDQMYHVIFCDALDLNGDVEVRLSRISQHLQYAHLVKGGLVIPANVALIGQLISSDWLENQNRVSDETISSFKLASQVNLFQVTQATCIDISRLKYEALSEPTVLAPCCLKMRSEVTNVPVIRDGLCNAILCWYEVQLLRFDESLTTKRGNSFVDSSAFLARDTFDVVRGDTVNVVRCVDCDGMYKLVLDLDMAP